MTSLAPSSSAVGPDHSPDIAPSLGRRALDVVVSATMLVALLPVLLGLAVAVRVSSPGPALFRQVRVGQGGREFTLLKYRSMTAGATGPHVTAGNDARITPVGGWLRRTSLDELPQLWHVLTGRMTLVGPRPETPSLAARYPADTTWVFAHRPGITGPSQVRMRDCDVLPEGLDDPEAYYLETLVPQRVALDATFLSRPTLRATMASLVETAGYLLGRRP